MEIATSGFEMNLGDFGLKSHYTCLENGGENKLLHKTCGLVWNDVSNAISCVREGRAKTSSLVIVTPDSSLSLYIKPIRRLICFHREDEREKAKCFDWRFV